MSETAATLRDRVKLRLAIAAADTARDALLDDLILDAQGYLANNCRASRTDAETAEIANLTVVLSVIAYTRLGMEGQGSHSEGGVSVSVVDGLPKDLQARIDRLRVARVG